MRLDAAGDGDHVRQRRDRRPRRRDRGARLAVPLHRRRAADAGLHLVGADGRACSLAASPSAAVLAGLFFAALQTGGFAMQRETSVPRVLTLVLQAIVILFLADAAGRRAARRDERPLHPVSCSRRRCRRSRRSCLPSLAGVLCGQVGVFNLALEGQMLVGAFAAVAGSYFAHSALAGVAAAMAGAVIFSLVARLWRDDLPRRSGRDRHRHEPSGVGSHRLSPARRVRGQRHVQRSGQSSDSAAIAIAPLIGVPVVGWAFARQSALTWVAWALTALVGVVLFRTPWASGCGASARSPARPRRSASTSRAPGSRPCSSPAR